VRSFSLLVAVAGLALSASQASAQCYYIAPPCAPDMRYPGFYYMNCYGVIYGPNWCVRPPFPPYQGALLGPSGYAAEEAKLNGFPRHLFARSPRDFFMVDTEPPASPYHYGNAAGILRGIDACNNDH
jgi:hypothetical protein